MGTARGSRERAELFDCITNFEENFQQRENIKQFLESLAAASPKERVKVKQLYNRLNNGQLDDSLTIKIPKGKVVFLVEGMNSARFLSEIEKPSDVRIARYMIGIYPAVSALKAILRDIDEKKEIKKALKEGRKPNPIKSPESSIRGRIKEVAYTLKQWRDNLENQCYDRVFWRNQLNHDMVNHIAEYLTKLQKRGINISKEMIDELLEEEIQAFYGTSQHATCSHKCECYLYQGLMSDSIQKVLNRGSEREKEISSFESAVNTLLHHALEPQHASEKYKDLEQNNARKDGE